MMLITDISNTHEMFFNKNKFVKKNKPAGEERRKRNKYLVNNNNNDSHKTDLLTAT